MRLPAARGVALSIGVFDGVHVGHQALIRELVREARATDQVAAVLTFDPPPRAVLDPDARVPRLCSLEERDLMTAASQLTSCCEAHDAAADDNRRCHSHHDKPGGAFQAVAGFASAAARSVESAPACAEHRMAGLR